jgi:hypothetical protein
LAFPTADSIRTYARVMLALLYTTGLTPKAYRVTLACQVVRRLGEEVARSQSRRHNESVAPIPVRTPDRTVLVSESRSDER